MARGGCEDWELLVCDPKLLHETLGIAGGLLAGFPDGNNHTVDVSLRVTLPKAGGQESSRVLTGSFGGCP